MAHQQKRSYTSWFNTLPLHSFFSELIRLENGVFIEMTNWRFLIIIHINLHRRPPKLVSRTIRAVADYCLSQLLPHGAFFIDKA